MDYKGIIFDLDGVICFTDKYHYLAWKKMGEDEGIEVDESVNDRLRGVSRAESLEIVLEKAKREYSPEEKKFLMEKKNNIYRDFLKTMTPADVSDEVRNTLENLRSRGFKLAIGSSSKNAKFILERVGMRDFFDAISDGENIQRTKPDPQVFLMAADMLGLDPKTCVVVEDAQAGIDAACAGGFGSAGLGPARNYEKTQFPLDTFSDLLKIF